MHQTRPIVNRKSAVGAPDRQIWRIRRHHAVAPRNVPRQFPHAAPPPGSRDRVARPRRQLRQRRQRKRPQMQPRMGNFQMRQGHRPRPIQQ